MRSEIKNGRMKYGVLAAVLVLLAGGVWAAKDYIVPHTWRYKITIEIETPEGVNSGSAVREVRAWKNAAKLVNPDISQDIYQIIGEAVIIDLGERGKVFVLVDWNSYYEVEAAFPQPTSDSSKLLEYFATLKLGLKADLPNNHPKLVMLRDINDPKSIQLVYEQKMGVSIGEIESIDDHFEEVLGKGFKLKGIIIQITDEPITSKIANEFPWFKEYSGHSGYLGGEQQPPFEDYSKTYVKQSNFKRGQ